MAFISTNDVIIKIASDRFTVGQILMVRGMLAVAIFAVILLVKRWPVIPRVALGKWNLIRAFCEAGATLLFVTGLTLLPIATVSSLGWTSPILVTMGAAFVLRERVTLGHWFAVLAGFTGVILVTQPWGDTFSWAMLLPLGTAIFVCMRELVTKKIDQRVRSMHITLATLIVVTLMGLAMSIHQLPSLTGKDVMWLGTSALLLSLGFLCQITAIRSGDLSFIAPFSFSGILFASIYGYLVWSDPYNLGMICGFLLIVSAGIYLVTRRS